MSLSELWPQLANLHAEQDSGSPMTWKVLYARRHQPLLVPLDILQARRAIAFFMHNPLLRYWGNLMLTLDHLMPRLHLLPIVRLENFPYTSLFGNNDLEGANSLKNATDFNNATLFFGFPGPLQKLTIYCPDPNGGLGKVAKIALHQSANEAITLEAHWLGKLSGSQHIARFLPHFLLQGILPCGRRYFSMRSLPQGVSSQRFGKLHYDFLHILAQQKPVFGYWNKSQAHLRLYERTQAVLPILDQSLRKLLLDALAEVELQIGQAELPTCMIHGDFAPWNLLQTNGELFVFDWEYAQTNGNPLQDFLHFHLIPRALHRWPLRTKMMPSLLDKAVAYADNQFGDSSDAGSEVAAASGALVTHYLLDTVTFYVAASGYVDYTHPVLRTYIKLLQERKQWLPQNYSPTSKSHALQHCG